MVLCKQISRAKIICEWSVFNGTSNWVIEGQGSVLNQKISRGKILRSRVRQVNVSIGPNIDLLATRDYIKVIKVKIQVTVSTAAMRN